MGVTLVCGCLIAVLFGLVIVLAVAGKEPLRPAPGIRRRIDDFMPAYQFNEVHSISVRAPAKLAFQAIRQVTAREIRFFRILTWIRSPRLPGSKAPESILNPSPDRPILEVATACGFILLAQQANREVVLGKVVLGDRIPAVADPQGFMALTRAGCAKAVISFQVRDEGKTGSVVTTETRVLATDSSSRRKFAAYWRVIHPGSALIRRMWLRAIRRRAEGR